MTDRERLLEQVREQEDAASSFEWIIRQYCVMNHSPVLAARYATRAAHHALTAMALREMVEFADHYSRWLAGPSA